MSSESHRDHEYEDIALHESRISPTNNRYIEGDTITEVTNKLSSINQSHTIDNYSRSCKYFEAERTRIEGVEKQDTIEGVEKSAAAQHLKNRQWDQVLPAVSRAFGSTNSPPATEQLQASLTTIKMDPTDTVYSFLDRLKSLIANIHVTFQVIEEIPAEDRLSFETVY